MNKLITKTSKNLLKTQTTNFSLTTNPLKNFTNLEKMNEYLNKKKPAMHIVLITQDWNPL